MRVGRLVAMGAVGCALLVAAEAKAETYMWGGGLSLGTIAVPGQYPWGFPPAVGDAGTISRVRGDFLLGLDGMLYADENTRFGLAARFDFAKFYSDANFMLKYDYVSQQGGDIDLVTGLGLGYGSQKFKGYNEEVLKIPYFPARGEAGIMYRNGAGALQALLFAQYDLPANHHYTDWNGSSVDVGTGFYLLVGFEASILYGDFTPPKKKTTQPKPKNNTPAKPTTPSKPTTGKPSNPSTPSKPKPK